MLILDSEYFSVGIIMRLLIILSYNMAPSF
jgi:hypothetical protein